MCSAAQKPVPNTLCQSVFISSSPLPQVPESHVAVSHTDAVVGVNDGEPVGGERTKSVFRPINTPAVLSAAMSGRTIGTRFFCVPLPK